jgi:hypothetical protein
MDSSKFLIFSLIVFFFCSGCKPIEENSNIAADSLKKEKEEIAAKDEVINYPSDDCYAADEFVYVFVNFLNSDSVFLCTKGSYFMEKQLVDNKHVANQVDSIYLFSSDLNQLEYYITHSGKRFFRNGQIKGNDLCLDDKIKIGASKGVVFSNSAIEIDMVNDIVKVCDTEQMTFIDFYFKNDLLEKINIKNIVD